MIDMKLCKCPCERTRHNDNIETQIKVHRRSTTRETTQNHERKPLRSNHAARPHDLKLGSALAILGSRSNESSATLPYSPSAAIPLSSTTIAKTANNAQSRHIATSRSRVEARLKLEADRFLQNSA
ncbi:hypothetical protein BD410DRAFT_213064 [Rickenella mellea]|uniref:Uncharacterized protein n=1 Tax=Rickenella mellea TaxID=50990 RepID=A0A4Y7Q5I6_9AGAM|nr:hypothetical protein BD410DRAFT_213064 [Rickenella mellea]